MNPAFCSYLLYTTLCSKLSNDFLDRAKQLQQEMFKDWGIAVGEKAPEKGKFRPVEALLSAVENTA